MLNTSNILTQSSNRGIFRIKLNEPDTYNALSFKTISFLIGILKKLNEDKNTKVIIIEGLGKGFCAGHDLKEVKSLKGKPKYKKLFDQCSRLMINIVNSICLIIT